MSRCFSSQPNGSHNICIVADYTVNQKTGEASLSPFTRNAVTAARKIDTTAPISILIIGDEKSVQNVATTAASISQVYKVFTYSSDNVSHHLAETVSPILSSIIKSKNFSHVVWPVASESKNILPRVSVALNVQPITDVIDIQSPSKFVRPIYAGNAFCTLSSLDPVKLLTIRSTAFEQSPLTNIAAEIESVDSKLGADSKSNTEFVNNEISTADKVDLTSARVVVSGGRGLKSGEAFSMLDELAGTLNGAVGATRAAVDAGFVPNEMQIGQTGKVVAPELYIAVGISGAIQHLAGMKDSKCIVAINKDAEAPIFQVAD